ncbi:MAG: tryptophan-rich sensory protein [Sphaerochaetaceae bacterium]
MDKTEKSLAFLVALTYLAMVVVNALANTLPIGGMGTGEISDLYPNLFAPAGITFSIWGIIYLLLAFHTIYQFRKGNKSIQISFSISSVVNILWILAWHHRKIGISLLLMFILLVSLIRINNLIDLQTTNKGSYWALALPFSIYLGWITVATIANSTVFLVSVGWKGWSIGEPGWTVVALVLGVIIGLTWAFRRGDKAYLLTLVWAYAGILLKHTTQDGFASQYPLVIVVVCLSIVLFIIALVLMFVQKKQSSSSSHDTR